MAKPSKDGKTLVQFNVKDAVYSVEGEAASVKPLTYMNTVTYLYGQFFICSTDRYIND